IIGAYDVWPRRRNPNVSRDIDHGIGGALTAVRVVTQRPARILVGYESGKIDPIDVDQRAACVTCRDQYGAFLNQEPRCMLSDSSETFDHDASTLQIESDEGPRHVDAGGDPKSCGADFVQRYAPDGAWKTDSTTGLILDPAHAHFIGTHVGTGYVVGNVADGLGKSAD